VDIFLIPIIDRELLLQNGMLPVCVGHADAFELAVHYALSTIHAAVAFILQHKSFGSTIQDRELDGMRWTILDAQGAAGAFGGNKRKHTAIPLWRRDFDRGI
jgi:hypothetical protein